MKKLILFVMVFQLFCVVSFAQEKAKPTKQETMDWIAEKIKNNINSDGSNALLSSGSTMTEKYQFLDYSKDAITIRNLSTYITSNGSENTEAQLITVDLNKIKNYSYSKRSFVIFGDKNLNCTKKANSSVCSYSDMFSFITAATDYITFDVMSFAKEKDLLDRFKKALDVLIEYNKQNDKPEPF